MIRSNWLDIELRYHNKLRKKDESELVIDTAQFKKQRNNYGSVVPGFVCSGIRSTSN